MSKRVLCKFFAHGACLKGDHCEFSHDWKAPPNNVCTFYQKGLCAYGSRCRYDHVKTKPLPPASSSSTDLPHTVANVSGTVTNGSAQFSPYDGTAVHSLFHEAAQSMPSSGPPHADTAPSWEEKPAYFDVQESEGVGYARSSINPADLPMCSFAAAGDCPHKNDCPHIHGDLCTSCGKHCLHPFRPEEREEHVKTCEKRQKHLTALRQSQEIECSVCLERVLSKSVLAERKFGILSECDHAFCISCIRNWRSSSPASGFDVNSALRACPICRKLSYFVIPSVIWYSVKEEKQEIVDSYKAKLRSIDCKHFDFGNGSCPFGTSCFYKHAYRDGRLEEATVRHLGAEDGNTVIAKSIRLSDFLSNMRLR